MPFQVAVKRLNTGGAPTESETAFLEEVQVLQLASATCQRVCRMLGCCKVDGDPCIVMTLYPKSVAKRLEEAQGNHTYTLCPVSFAAAMQASLALVCSVACSMS